MTLRIALDHNFPIPIVDAMATGIAEAELVPISRIDRRLTTLEDHDVVRAVSRREFDVLVSCDHDMFQEPMVLTAILQTRMSVVAALGQGHDRIAAAGLVLAHLPNLARRFRKDEAQLFKLRVGHPAPTDPWDELDRLARRGGTDARQLYDSMKLDEAMLRRDPIDDT